MSEVKESLYVGVGRKCPDCPCCFSCPADLKLTGACVRSGGMTVWAGVGAVLARRYVLPAATRNWFQQLRGTARAR